MPAQVNPSKFLWQDLNKSLTSLTDPWMVVGNFDSVTRMEELSNSRKLDQQRCTAFSNWIIDNGLLDMGYSGPKFTWTRRKHYSTFQVVRLDITLFSLEWSIQFPNSQVTNLPKMHSDHSPILVRVQRENCFPRDPQFRFQVPWLTHLDFSTDVQKQWKDETSLLENIKNLPSGLLKWNKDCFGNIHRKKRRLLAKLKGEQSNIVEKGKTHLLKLERKLLAELDLVLKQEELLRFQKSREDWITLRDRNTRYYHHPRW